MKTFRVLLSVSLASLSGGPEAFAQTRMGAVGEISSLPGQAGAFGGLSAAPGLAASPAPTTLTLSAPSLPITAAPALTPAALTPSALIPAAAKGEKPVAVTAIPAPAPINVPAAPEIPAGAPKLAAVEGGKFEALLERVRREARAWELPVEDLLKEADVLSFGEIHSSMGAPLALADEMPRLKAAGVTYLGLENLSPKDQPAIDAYLAGGPAFPKLNLIDGPRSYGYRELFAAARRAGVRILAMDTPFDEVAERVAAAAALIGEEKSRVRAWGLSGQQARADSGRDPAFTAAFNGVVIAERNRAMAGRLAAALSGGGKAVVLIGAAHLTPPPGAEFRAGGSPLAGLGTFDSALRQSTLRTFSVMFTGGMFLKNAHAAVHRLVAGPLYRLVDALLPGGNTGFFKTSDATGIYNLGPGGSGPASLPLKHR